MMIIQILLIFCTDRKDDSENVEAERFGSRLFLILKIYRIATEIMESFNEIGLMLQEEWQEWILLSDGCYKIRSQQINR